MAYTKPGKVIGGFTWTGKRWVKTPERMSDKVALEKEIRSQTSRTNREREKDELKARTTYPGNYTRMSNPVARKPMSDKNIKKASAEGPKRSTAKPTAAQSAAANKTADKPAPARTPAASKTSTSSSTQKKTAAPKGKAVSQSNTMWVKKGDTVGGKTVEKGYLAQYGKPEKKVTANVKLVVDTARGKAGSKVSYNKGRATKKGK